MRKLSYGFLLCIVLIAGCQGEIPQHPIDFETKVFLQAVFKLPRNLEKSAFGSEMEYLIWLPEGYGEDPSQKWPLIFYLHGAGLGEEGSKTQMSSGLPLAIYLNEQPEDFPFIVIAPRAFSYGSWTDGNTPEILAALLDEVNLIFSVDQTRVYLTGYSMGGYGSWYLAMRFPESFAAMVSVSGSGEYGMLENLTAFCRLSRVPVWAIHGEMDMISPAEHSQKYVDALSECPGAQIDWTVYPGIGHIETSERVYRDPEIFSWMLKQVKILD